MALRGLYAFCCSLLLIPMWVFAQETPVTVILRFDEEVSLGAGCVPRSTLCASERNSALLFNQIVLPSISTQMEKAELARQGRKGAFSLTPRIESKQAGPEPPHQWRPRTFGGQLRYERVALDNVILPDLDGNIYSANAHMLWDLDDYSFGLLIPYEAMDLDSFDVHRFAFMGFGQYRFLVNTRTLLTYSVNGNYAHAAVSATGGDNLNVFGGGFSVALTVDQDRFVGGGAVSYQFHIDDSGRDNDKQHLVKIGANAGLRLGENGAFTLFGTLNFDPTPYDNTLRDVDQLYVDFGFELAWSLSPTWKLTGGYKKALGLADFDSDTVFLGTLLRF
jgi:hypothetical protein